MRASAFIWLLVLCLPVASHAAEEPVDPDLSTEGMRSAGPFHVRPFLLLKQFGYDDNIRFETPERVGDTVATLTPGLEGVLLVGHRGGVFISQEFDRVSFAEHTSLNHWNAASRARGILLTKPAVFSLETRYRTLRERPNLEIDHRVRQEQHAIIAAIRTVKGRRLGAEMFVRRERFDFASDTAESERIGRLLARDEHTFSLLGSIQLLPKTILTLQGIAERADFKDGRELRDTRAGSILLGVRFDPSALLQGDFQVGFMSLTATGRPDGGFRGWIGEGKLSTRLGRSGRLGGGLRRDLIFSTVEENLYYVSTGWSAAYEQFFSQELSGKLTLGRVLNHYPKELMLVEPLPAIGIRDDQITTYQLEIRYRFNERFAITAKTGHLQRNSTDDSLDRSRNIYAVGTNYYF